MYVRKVIIEGFMPFKEKQEVIFANKKIIGVRGAYDGDFSKSNRAGKSAFVDAIVWNLYGKSRAKKDVELIFNDNDKVEVTVELFDELKDESHLITRWRTKDNKGKVELHQYEGEKKKATQEEIDKLIGMTYEEFLFTAFFKQDDIDQFMLADSQKKKQILMRWMPTNNWAVYEQKANELKNDLNRKRIRIQSSINGLPEGEINAEELKTETHNIMTVRKTRQADIEAHSQTILNSELQLRALSQVEGIENKSQQIENKLKQLRGQRTDSDKYMRALNQIDENLKKYPEIGQGKYEEVIDKERKLSSAKGELKVLISKAGDEIDQFGKKMTGFCPILKEECSRIDHDPEKIVTLNKMKVGYSKKYDLYSQHEAKCQKIQKLFRAQKDWENQRETLIEKSRYAKQIEKQIGEFTREKGELLKSIPENVDETRNTLVTQVKNLRASIQDHKEKIAEWNQRLGQIQELLKVYKEKANRLEAYNLDLSSVEIQLADATYVEYMFGKNGIPSIELENSFQEIENDANVILRSLNAPFHLEFEAMRELNDWEPNCLACGVPFEKGERSHICKDCKTPREKRKRDELSLRIYEGDQERPFYLDSGGGNILQSVGIRLALTQLARRRKGSNWGTIFIDELFGKLDQTNRRVMADLISSTLLKGLGFEQIFMISHDPSIQSATAENLVITRDQEAGYSTLALQ